jgi:hypothetical protein
MTNQEIAEMFISLLEKQNINATLIQCKTGSVYVNIIGSLQRIRISNHGKHRDWFRYNIRTDLKLSRNFRIAGQRVYLYTESDIKKAANRVIRDFRDKRKIDEKSIINPRRSIQRGGKKDRTGKKNKNHNHKEASS